MLTLPIIKKWFDKIRCGEKPEEYRDIKPYYVSRLQKYVGQPEITYKLRNGYAGTAPALTLRGKVTIGYGNPEWGAEEGKLYFILGCRELLEVKIYEANK